MRTAIAHKLLHGERGRDCDIYTTYLVNTPVLILYTISICIIESVLHNMVRSITE